MRRSKKKEPDPVVRQKAPEIGEQHLAEGRETPYTDADVRRDLLGGVEADVEGDSATAGRALSED